MRKSLIVSAVIMAAALFAHLPLNASETITFNTWGMGAGKLVQNSISKAELARMPSWNPNDGPPPISHGDAVRIARHYLKEKSPKFANAEIAEIKLAQFLVPEYHPNKWFYCIVFMNGIPVTSGIPEHITIVVMLDGSVNEPHPLK